MPEVIVPFRRMAALSRAMLKTAGSARQRLIISNIADTWTKLANEWEMAQPDGQAGISDIPVRAGHAAGSAMNKDQRAVTDGNIDQMFRWLVVQTDIEQCGVYHKIMLTEENRFTNLSERLELSGSALVKCDVYIARQKERVEKAPDGDHRKALEMTWHVLVTTRALLSDYRAGIRKALQEPRL